MASVFPLFGSAFFRNLGIGPGSSLLAGISIAMMPIYFVSLFFWNVFQVLFIFLSQLLIRYGDRLRTRSRYAM